MIETDPVQLQGVLGDLQVSGDVDLQLPGDITEPDSPCGPVVEDRLGDHARGVGEVHHPGLGGHLLRNLHDLEDLGDRPKGLGQPADPGGLLADEVVPEAHEDVLVPPLLAANPDLDHHEVRAMQPGAEIRGGLYGQGTA